MWPLEACLARSLAPTPASVGTKISASFAVRYVSVANAKVTVPCAAAEPPAHCRLTDSGGLSFSVRGPASELTKRVDTWRKHLSGQSLPMTGTHRQAGYGAAA